MNADTSSEALNEFLSNLVRGCLEALESAGCITLGDEHEEGGGLVDPTTAGRYVFLGWLALEFSAQAFILCLEALESAGCMFSRG